MPDIHFRKNNNKTIYQPMDENFAETKGTLIIDSGEIYYTLLFEPLQCCVFATIDPVKDEKEEENEEKEENGDNEKIENEKDEEEKFDLDFWRLWPDYDDPHSTYPGPVIEAGFYINMDLKLLVLYDNKKKKEVYRRNFPKSWNKIYPVVKFKHKVSITISSNAVREKPSFIKI